ncbi:deoxyribonuclease IV [candidate division KSB1 bacterium]|nr:MAG: deoxyribonuclease IV [candidate division KSB1 bacterium]
MLLGAHMSIAGGVDKSIERGYSIGCSSIQIFTKSNNQWKAKELKDDEILRFKQNRVKYHINPIVAHDSYLINLAANRKEVLKKSIESFFIEMERCELLNIPYLVMHPGAHLGAGEDEGMKVLIDSFNQLLERSKGFKVIICLETTAGQGTNLGYRFEHIARIIDSVMDKNRFGCCYDTAHTFAAGYDIRDEKAYNKTMKEFDEVIGMEKLKVIHLNDSKKELGSKIDRHEHIGKGFLGLEAFRFIMNDERFVNIPKILETPKGPDMKEDIENLAVLKSLVEKS